ncbi:IS3 family transposase [Actinomadura coerulea]|uniref:IS3 family transposase n=1 Tax=Actinomadura coerulea TaxID=46159 RepID=UPI00342F762B
MCRVLDLCPRTYYGRKRRPPSAGVQRDAVLIEQITDVHQASYGTYGAYRVHKQLRRQGVHGGAADARPRPAGCAPPGGAAHGGAENTQTATGARAGDEVVRLRTGVAYVFIHLLPEIAEGNEAVGEALTDVLRPTPLRLPRRTHRLHHLLRPRAAGPPARRHPTTTPDDADAQHPPGNPQPPDQGSPGSRLSTGSVAGVMLPAGVYWLHLGSFMIHNALITYTMPLRLRTGIGFATLFKIAMGLHFVLTDRGLQERYPRRFARSSRFALSAALLVGWVLAALFPPPARSWSPCSPPARRIDPAQCLQGRAPVRPQVQLPLVPDRPGPVCGPAGARHRAHRATGHSRCGRIRRARPPDGERPHGRWLA